MIRDSANGKHPDFFIARDAEHVRPQILAAFGINHCHSSFGAENAMHKVRRICVAHVLSPLRGFPPALAFPALTRWANEFRPFGLAMDRLNGPVATRYVYPEIVPYR